MAGRKILELGVLVRPSARVQGFLADGDEYSGVEAEDMLGQILGAAKRIENNFGISKPGTTRTKPALKNSIVSAIRNARNKFPSSSINFSWMRNNHIPFPEASHDEVWAFDVYSWVGHPDSEKYKIALHEEKLKCLIADSFRVLKPGGHKIVVLSSRSPILSGLEGAFEKQGFQRETDEHLLQGFHARAQRVMAVGADAINSKIIKNPTLGQVSAAISLRPQVQDKVLVYRKPVQPPLKA